MRQLTTTTPSGMRARLRGLQGAEINLFANKTEAEARRIGYDLLDSVVLEVEDNGPCYAGERAPDWRDVIEADRFWLYLYTRIATYGPDYHFRYQCSNGGCRKEFHWGIKLDRDLRQQKLSADSIAAFVAGNKFDIKLGDTSVSFSLLTGRIEEKGEQLQGLEPTAAQTIILANRIRSVDSTTDRKSIHDWVKALDMLDLLDLVDAMDEHDGGIDTDIQIQCPHCRTIQRVSLPLGGDFWIPPRELRSHARRGVEIAQGGGPIRLSSDS